MKGVLKPNPKKSPVEYFQMALDMVKEITGFEPDPDQEARLLIESGKVCDSAGEWAQALEKLEDALSQSTASAVRLLILLGWTSLGPAISPCCKKGPAPSP